MKKVAQARPPSPLPPSGIITLDSTLRRFFGGPEAVALLAPGQGLIVAFSGGVDSTALLLGLARLAPEAGFSLIAAHLDHGLDPGSAERARSAAGIAAAVGVSCEVERRCVPDLRLPGESSEVAGRRIRYAYLKDVQARHGSRWVATAHQRGDQAETVLLRLLFGSGVEGLAGIRPVDGAVVRPLLDLPRATLAAVVAEAALAPLADPGNSDLAVPRNRLRHRVLPALAAEDPEIEERLARLAGAAARARRALERRLAEELLLDAATGLGGEPEDRRDEGAAAVRREQLARLPEPLRPLALASLHRRAGAPYPASRAARAELARQLASPHRVGCDCGGGWRWQVEGDLLVLRYRGPSPLLSSPLPQPSPSQGGGTATQR
jgi:tRNA(Ile)-lysidine synthase